MRPQRTGVAGLLPLRHLGPAFFPRDSTLTFRGTFDFTLDAKNRLTVPSRFRAASPTGVVLAAGRGLRRDLAAGGLRGLDHGRAQGHNPLSPEYRKLKRLFCANSSRPSSTGPGA